jgi:FKBP12-rapamycin complex-associated protein
MVDLINKHVFAAVRGFSKSISLGFKYDKRGRFILQDTLRLLSMIFKYGHLDEVAKEFTENYKSIDIIAWINVVPQILARIQIQNLTIQGLLHHLLIHISRVHP